MNNIISEKNKEKYDKWYDGYIDGVNVNEIVWKKLNYEELITFFHQNYYDDEYESFVMIRNMDNNFLPLGMTYLTFNKEKSHDEYIIGVVKNKLGLETIVACMRFNSKYLVEYDSIKPVTYIDTIETNVFFQKQGILRTLVLMFLLFGDINQNILISPENGIGKEIGIIERVKKILLEQGFSYDIRSEYEIDEEYLESLKDNKRKRKNK